MDFTTTTMHPAPDDDNQDDDDVLVCPELVPPHDAHGFQFVVKLSPTKFDVPTAPTSRAPAVVTKEEQDDDDDTWVQWEVLPPADTQQFKFGMTATVPAFDVADQNVPSAPPRGMIDNPETVQYEVLPKQDTQQYHFGMPAQPQRTWEFVSSPNGNLRVPRNDADKHPDNDMEVYQFEVVPKQDAHAYHFGMAASHHHHHHDTEHENVRPASKQPPAAAAIVATHHPLAAVAGNQGVMHRA